MLVELKAFDNLLKEKETLKVQNQFSENYDKTKLVDVSKMLVKKRPREDNNDDDIKVENEKIRKLQ